MKKRTDRYTLCAGTPARYTADYLLALIPVYIWSIYAFGAWNTHLLLSTALISSIVFSLCMQLAVYRRIEYRKLLTAAVIGFCIGFLMPPVAPMWLVVLGTFIATVPFYLPYAGQYLSRYVHPIALAVVILSFGIKAMTPTNDALLIESASYVTPMASLLDGFIPEESIYDLLLGRHSGLIGEVSVFMVLIGGMYLYFRKLIHIEVPVSMLATLAILSYAFPAIGSRLDYLIAQMFTGSIFFVAVYLLPFFDTMPRTNTGRLVFGVMCGALTYVFRRFYDGYDGVFIALLISAAITRLIEPLIINRPILWKSDF